VANLKIIRKRISSVKSTQKITRAMKMVAGARLNRAQNQIQAMRPYAVETARVLHSVVGSALAAQDDGGQEAEVPHPLLARREEKRVLYLVLTSDRGLCGAFNSSVLRKAEALWKQAQAAGKEVQFHVVGRKGRDYLKRRNAPVAEVLDGVWDKLSIEQARRVARGILRPFAAGQVDAIYLVYNEFKSAMTQTVVAEPLFPLSARVVAGEAGEAEAATPPIDYVFEPDQSTLLSVLVPMYVEVTVLRALYESTASELGARMTAMDSATKNARDMIAKLTLQYNRARQAAITTELMEIIGGAEALGA
jgi:F-type H+-transporting ATPase subunit gamma